MGNKKKQPPPSLEDHITPVYKIECHFCGARCDLGWEDETFSAADAFLTLYGDGWRVVTSKKYQCVAAACPDCAKKKDKDR